jgi:hypothetical protein
VRRYDPLEAPEPGECLSLGESERIRLAQDYHRRAHIRLSNLNVKAMIHAVVENQIALGDEIPTGRTLVRLMGEDLDRHEAIDAIGLALSDHIYDLLLGPEHKTDPNEPYYVALDRIMSFLRSTMKR